MGTNSAVICRKVIENAFEVLAIQIITICQAIDALDQKDKVSSSTRKLYDDVRAIIPTFSEDLVFYPYLEKVKNYLINRKNA
jgi:histidine ammonia-lyase